MSISSKSHLALTAALLGASEAWGYPTGMIRKAGGSFKLPKDKPTKKRRAKNKARKEMNRRKRGK